MVSGDGTRPQRFVVSKCTLGTCYALFTGRNGGAYNCENTVFKHLFIFNCLSFTFYSNR